MTPVTIKDIAREVGVSLQTASRILGGKEHLHRPDTCAKVREAARRLGYSPSYLTQAIKGGRSMTIGFLLRGRLRYESVIKRFQGLVLAAQEHGYLVYPVTLDRLGSDEDDFVKAVRDLVARRVDGLVVYRGTMLSPATRRLLDAQAIPTVFADWGPARSKHRVFVDRTPAMNQAAEHLASLGHRTVALLPTRDAYDFLEHKVRPYERALIRHGLIPLLDKRWVINPTHEDQRGGYHAAEAFLAARTAATAMIMGSDAHAVGAMSALRHAGLRVPQDLSVIGSGDRPAAACAEPPLTTLRTAGEELGAAAFQTLLKLIEDPSAGPQRVTFPADLILRQSTGPAPATPPSPRTKASENSWAGQASQGPSA